MKFKPMDIIVINFTVMFMIAFFHFLFVSWLNIEIDKLAYLGLMFLNSLIVFKTRKSKINKGIIKLSIFFIFFILLLLYSVFENILYSSISYHIYLFIQIILLTYIFSNINYQEFKRVILAYRNAYLITTVPLFILYLLDAVLGLYTFPNRFIVFDTYRFGGFISEPRGMSIFSTLTLATILIVKRLKYQKLEILFIAFVIFSTFSNSTILLFILFPIMYFFFKLSILKKVIYLVTMVFIFVIGWYFMPDFSVGRFIFSKDSIIMIFNNIDSINDFDPGGVNAFNIRLWIFLKGLMALEWYGLGFYSAHNIATLKGLPQSDAIGIITILADFGYIFGVLIIFYGLYLMEQYKKISKNIFTFLIILFLLILMSPPYSKFYLPLYVYFFILFAKTKNEIILESSFSTKKGEIQNV